MAGPVVTTVDRVEEIVQGVRRLTGQEVLVGVPAKDAQRDGGPVSNAAIGYWMEFGVPESNVPARPFLVPGVRNYEDRAVLRLRRAAELALEGQGDKANQQLTAIGLEAVSAVKAKITEGPFVPLAPSTIARRIGGDTSRLGELYKHATITSAAHVGLTGVQPLINTGKLRNSINFVLRKR